MRSKWAAIWSIGFADRSQCRNKRKLSFAPITAFYRVSGRFLGLDNIEQSPKLTNIEITRRKEGVRVMFATSND
jgi:hypothetical protein